MSSRELATPDRGGQDGSESTRNLRSYLGPLAERWKVVAVCLGATVAVSMLFAFLRVPEYKAGATLKIERRSPEVVAFDDVVRVDPSYAAYSDFYQTEHRILQSKAVLAMAAEEVDLLNRPEYASRRLSPIQRLRGWVYSLTESDTPDGAAEPYDPLDKAVDYLGANLGVRPVINTRLVSISFVDQDPVLARDIANAIVDAYCDRNLSARFDTNDRASEFLTKQVAKLDGEIRQLEERLQQYGSDKELLSLADENQDVSAQALTEFNAMLTEAKGRLALTEARYRTAIDTPATGLAEVMASPLINNLKQQYADLDRQYGQMSERFKPGWPALKQLQDELDSTARQLETEAAEIADGVRSVALAGYQRSQAEVFALHAGVADQKVEVRRVNLDAIEYANRRSEIDTKRKLLDELINRQSETAVTGALRKTRSSNIQIVDRAETPKAPIRPRKLLTLAISSFFGLLLGIGAALLLENLDNTVKDERDVERYAGLPALAQIPIVEQTRIAPGDELRAASNSEIDLGTLRDPQSAFAEAFKILRTSLLLASPEHPPRHVVITSPEPHAGKSMVSANLAVALSQMGRSVLLIDADLRRSRCHQILGVPNRRGLSSYLTGNAEIEEVIQETSVPNLRVISAGPIPPAPAELLGASHIDQLLERLIEEHGFDHVILDSPPTLQIADSVILAPRADATIVVVRAGHTVKESLERAVIRLRRARVSPVGAVLNAVPERRVGYYGYYRYKRYDRKQAGSNFALILAGRRRRKRSRSA